MKPSRAATIGHERRLLTQSDRGNGVAYMAHVGGFVTGIVLGFVLRGRSRVEE
jgi:membrane associated rhomboid family serine protease